MDDDEDADRIAATERAIDVITAPPEVQKYSSTDDEAEDIRKKVYFTILDYILYTNDKS